jgi:hypothetical protein
MTLFMGKGAFRPSPDPCKTAFANLVIQTLRKQTGLTAICTLNKS